MGKPYGRHIGREVTVVFKGYLDDGFHVTGNEVTIIRGKLTGFDGARLLLESATYGDMTEGEDMDIDKDYVKAVHSKRGKK